MSLSLPTFHSTRFKSFIEILHKTKRSKVISSYFFLYITWTKNIWEWPSLTGAISQMHWEICTPFQQPKENNSWKKIHLLILQSEQQVYKVQKTSPFLGKFLLLNISTYKTSSDLHRRKTSSRGKWNSKNKTADILVIVFILFFSLSNRSSSLLVSFWPLPLHTNPITQIL